MSIRVEVLFPEFGNLFGDSWNARYLENCIPDAEFIKTSYSDTPAFVNEDVSMVYMGAMTESQQELVIEKLLPYKDRIQQMVKSGTLFLMTANAGEVFCDYIENEDGSRIDGLGVFHLHAKRDMMHRFNDSVICRFEGMKLVGFKAEFSQLYGDNSDFYFAEAIKGCGINKGTKLEGVKINNFISTSLVGPFLILNPHMVKYIMQKLGIENPKLAYEETIIPAYEKRLKEFESYK